MFKINYFRLEKNIKKDITIVGGGIMSLTLATILSEIYPKQKIILLERLHSCGEESSKGNNNAGTGHAGYCELNYTPINTKKNIEVSKAIQINEMFETSLQFWYFLEKKYKTFDIPKFLKKVPHMSFVSGKKDVSFLKQRYLRLIKEPLFQDMQYSEDKNVIRNWAPLLMKGRSRNEQVAATRIEYGTDINFGELCNQLLKILKKNKNFSLKVNSNVFNVSHTNNESFELKYKSHKDGKVFNIKSNKVFIGAGGMSINLLQNIGIKKVKGYAGYPISGEWLICSNKKLIKQHRTKIYGLPFPKAPAMSIPHLDLRVIDEHETLLFGPYASFTTKFLKHGSKFDFFKSIKLNNICSLLKVFFKNFPLLRYLIHQSFMTHQEKINQLKKFYPSANIKDWQTKSAGQRVQIIKKTPKGTDLEFGTEILYSSKKNLAGLIGASPGASTACSLMLDVVLNIYDDPKLPNKIKKMLPWYDLKLNENPKTLKKIRNIIYKKLNLV